MTNPFSSYNATGGSMFTQPQPQLPLQSQLYQTTASYGYQSQTPQFTQPPFPSNSTQSLYQTSSDPFSVQQLQFQQSQARQFPSQTLQFQTQQYQPQTFVLPQAPANHYEKLDFLETKLVNRTTPMPAVNATGHVPHNPFVSTAPVGSYTFGTPSAAGALASSSNGQKMNQASDLGRIQLQLLQQQQQLLQQQNQLQQVRRLQSQLPFQPTGYSTPQNATLSWQTVSPPPPPPPPNVDPSVWRELPPDIREEILKNPNAAIATRSIAQQPKPKPELEPESEPEPELEPARLTDEQLMKKMYKEQSNEYYNRRHFGGQQGRRFNE